MRGGRFNRTGVPALYLALTIEGMFLEMGYGFGRRFDPMTVCTYEVDVDALVDLRGPTQREREHISIDDLGCAWASDRMESRIPASWKIAERFMTEGASGLLVPSFANGAKADAANLVLWRWGAERPYRVHVFDPDHRLPKDRSSWDR